MPDLTLKLQTGTMAIECLIWLSGTQGVSFSSEISLVKKREYSRFFEIALISTGTKSLVSDIPLVLGPFRLYMFPY